MTILTCIDQIISSTTALLVKQGASKTSAAKSSSKQNTWASILSDGVKNLRQLDSLASAEEPLGLQLAEILTMGACTVSATEWARGQLFSSGAHELSQVLAYKSVDIWGRAQALYALMQKLADAIEHAKQGGLGISSVRARFVVLPRMALDIFSDLARSAVEHTKGVDILTTLKPLQLEINRQGEALAPVLAGYLEELPA